VEPFLAIGTGTPSAGSPAARGSSLTFLHADHLGTTRLGTRQDGTVAFESASMPFGDALGPPGDGAASSFFAGHLRGGGSTAIYMNARYYSPTLGRFLSADPIIRELVAPQYVNRYTYVLSNPIRANDPTGAFVEDSTQYTNGIKKGLARQVLDVFRESTKFTWTIVPGTVESQAHLGVAQTDFADQRGKPRPDGGTEWTAWAQVPTTMDRAHITKSNLNPYAILVHEMGHALFGEMHPDRVTTNEDENLREAYAQVFAEIFAAETGIRIEIGVALILTCQRPAYWRKGMMFSGTRTFRL
jgi:RHS repeat-associated protein